MYVLDEDMEDRPFHYVGFGIRFVAYLIDGFILGIIRWIVALFFGFGSMGFGWDLIWFGSLFSFIYFVLMESSANQASIGKQLMRIKVVDENGQRMDLSKSIIRNLMKMVSAAILLIGFIMVIFDERKRALHDMVAHTFVVENK
jgi:uncharacterized RDD family membrane protein YckC